MNAFFHSAAALVLSASALAAQQGTPGLHFIENWDIDGDGQVTLAEATERRGDVFVSFDADDNGSLSADEYVLFDEARTNDMQANAGAQGAPNKALQEAVAGMSLSFNDADGDGAVSEAEFIDGTAAWITRMDRNADGVVTSADFTPRG